MATAEGFRWAVAKLPTPGSGLDDEDRYAIGGAVLSANLIAALPFDQFRMAISAITMVKPGTQDVAWRAALVNCDWPTQGGSGFTATKRYYLAGAVMLPDGALTPNDRKAIGGVYPVGEESETFFDVFKVTYTLTPTSIPKLTTQGRLDGVYKSFTSAQFNTHGHLGMSTIEWFQYRKRQAIRRHGDRRRRPRFG